MSACVLFDDVAQNCESLGNVMSNCCVYIGLNQLVRTTEDSLHDFTQADIPIVNHQFLAQVHAVSLAGTGILDLTSPPDPTLQDGD